MLTDQVDWDTQLRENNGRVDALGLADLDRKLRPVGEAYRDLIKAWTEVLSTQSVCLQVPVTLAEDYPQFYGTAAAPGVAATTSSPKNAE